ncbi:MAG: cytochrome c family protein [Roseobacter sp.]
MFDTMTLTKAAGGVCGALLVFLLGKWTAEELYHVDSHGEASYVIEVEDSSDDGEVEEVDFATIMASASVESGAKVFKKCSACHKIVDGENGAGPYLYGVVGRSKAAADGFGYSGAMTSKGGEWTPENLSAFLEKPSAYIAGTSMSFNGLRKIEDRADVIAYLDSLDD